MVSAICSLNQHTFTKVVQSCCDLHRLNSYCAVEFRPSRKTEKCNCKIREFKTPIFLIFLKLLCPMYLVQKQPIEIPISIKNEKINYIMH